MYYIVDIQTNTVISKHETLKSAYRKADKLDNIFGAVRYIVKRQSN